MARTTRAVINKYFSISAKLNYFTLSNPCCSIFVKFVETITDMINCTPIARKILCREWETMCRDTRQFATCQQRVLKQILKNASETEYGRKHSFRNLLGISDPRERFRREIPAVGYEEIRPLVMRMIRGEKDILWRGSCRRFAQSSGTSGGKSKFIPVTHDSLRLNHYRGASLAVASYLAENPSSRLFSGKGLVLGGSFSSTLAEIPRGTLAGDLSATLINDISPLAEIFRVPDRKTALMPDWNIKLTALAEAAAKADVTNISGVPSWMLVVLRKVLEITGKSDISEVWRNLEVFFHGGISFSPYREEYRKIISGERMHYRETYNASEGFFAIQTGTSGNSMLLLPSNGIYYELIPLGGSPEDATTPDMARPGNVYELMITACNGLFRYRIGDTVKVTGTDPVTILIAGRTRSFINAFGEELMEYNADKAIAETCAATGAAVADYTAAPVYSADGRKGHHQWLVEWITPPADNSRFAAILDERLRALNSDYDAKRAGDIFLDAPAITDAPHGFFCRWLASTGSGKLGGQRKVPRLSNSRAIIDSMLSQLP